MTAFQFPPLALRLAQEGGVLRSSGVEVLEGLAMRLRPGGGVDELDGQVWGQRSVVADVGEDGGLLLLVLLLLLQSLRNGEQICEGVDAAQFLVGDAVAKVSLKAGKDLEIQHRIALPAK